MSASSYVPSRVTSAADEVPTIIDRAREGDDEARAALYREHAAVLTRRLAHACGDDELARDLAQDAFITAFARLATYRGSSNFSVWLHGIAFNHLRDRWKRRTRERSAKHRLALAESPGEAPSPESQTSSRQSLRRLQSVLSTLTPKLRTAFVLRVVEQLSLEESAQILGVRANTVSYRARKAESLVRVAFEGEGAEQ